MFNEVNPATLEEVERRIKSATSKRDATSSPQVALTYQQEIEWLLEQKKEFSNKPSPNINKLFHRLWTKAVGQEVYDKAEWKELARLLNEVGVRV